MKLYNYVMSTEKYLDSLAIYEQPMINVIFKHHYRTKFL